MFHDHFGFSAHVFFAKKSQAAQLYEAAGSYDQAASLYILDTNFEAAAPLMAKISTPKLHLQFAKAKESRGAYQDGILMLVAVGCWLFFLVWGVVVLFLCLVFLDSWTINLGSSSPIFDVDVWKFTSIIADNIICCLKTCFLLQDALVAYERARDLDSVVRICLDHLNQPQKAFQLVRETKLASGAQAVAEFCRKNGDVAGAVEFYLLAKNDEEAFLLAERQDEMATYEAGLGDNGTRDQYKRIAKYYEQRNLLADAARHYANCEEYHTALKLYLKVGEKEIDHAIEVVGRARNDSLTHTLIDYLMGETDNVPKDANYVYRLHKALGNYMQAAGTAHIIAKQEEGS